MENLPATPNLETSSGNASKAWEAIRSEAKVGLDHDGGLILQLSVGPDVVSVGASADNVLTSGSPAHFVQALLTARLQALLQRRSPPGASEPEMARDWELLVQAMQGDVLQDTDRGVQRRLTPSASLRSERADGNGPEDAGRTQTPNSE